MTVSKLKVNEPGLSILLFFCLTYMDRCRATPDSIATSFSRSQESKRNRWMAKAAECYTWLYEEGRGDICMSFALSFRKPVKNKAAISIKKCTYPALIGSVLETVSKYY